MVGAALLVLAVGIFFVSGQVGLLHGHYQLNAYFADAQGLRPGAQVQLAGVPVGNVSSVTLSNSENPNRAVLVQMRISSTHRNEIRADSVATIETAGLLGQEFVNISRGSVSQPVVAAEGDVKTSQQADIKAVVHNANDVLTNLTALSQKLNSITGQITAGKGTIGKFIYDPSLYNRLNDTLAKLQTVANELSHGNGTFAQLANNRELYDKLNSTVNRANQMMNQIQHGNGTVAKLINDPSMYNNLNQTITAAHDLLDGINNGHGTLGKLVKDPELYNRFNRVAANVDTITGRMAKGQGSLGLLSTNGRLYNNLSASSQSLREFLEEFRKSPKKYLTLHLRIF